MKGMQERLSQDRRERWREDFSRPREACEEIDSLLGQGNDEAAWERIFAEARSLTESRFQKSLCFFAPLYFSSYCANNCVYCGFRSDNRLLMRRALTEEELLQEARFLWDEGHRTLLLIAGEHPAYSGVAQIASYVEVLRGAGLDFTLMVEVGPLSLEDYRRLHALGINHCLLFQETYNRQIYARVHRGRKSDYNWRLEAMERALAGGIENVGLGILLGIGPWQEDLRDLIAHAYTLKERYGRFPATFSFPRLRPVYGGSSFQGNEVSDEDFQKILAASRLACPDVGIVLTTRETPSFRRQLLEKGIGITHMSAGSSTVPGGYTLQQAVGHEGQFELADHRSLAVVVQEVQKLGYHPFMTPLFKKS